MIRQLSLRTAIWVTLASLAGLAQAETNWPQFRGPRGDGSSPSTAVASEWSEAKNVSWKTAIHGRGWSSPVVWEDQVWLSTASGDGSNT